MPLTFPSWLSPTGRKGKPLKPRPPTAHDYDLHQPLPSNQHPPQLVSGTMGTNDSAAEITTALKTVQDFAATYTKSQVDISLSLKLMNTRLDHLKIFTKVIDTGKGKSTSASAEEDAAAREAIAAEADTSE
uniref:Uncharacterized protein n=1 Tax=Arundo donax TaxID=35708 RepID=A0A0A8ZXE3_ARUDO